MAGPVRIAIIANGRQARAEMTSVGATATRMGTVTSKAGKLIAGAFAVGTLIKSAGAIKQVGGEYVDSLNKIQALTGESASTVADAARQLESQGRAYAKYGQTAGDAAAGVGELSKSGLSLKDSMAAVQSTMVLAKAGELEVADASELVANTLNTFGLKAKRAGDIANYLANAANISSSDVTDLAESFKYVSPLAAKSGVSLADTNAILAELANSGIKASQAGTSLRGILVGLQAPSTAGSMWLQELGVSVYDAGGRMRPLPKIIEGLRTSLADLSEEDQNFALKSIFGRNSITAAQVLIKGGKKTIDEYSKGVQRAGAAAELAESASKGLTGTIGSLKAEAITAADGLYREYSPAIDKALVGAVDQARKQLPGVISQVKSAYSDVKPTILDLADVARDAGADLYDVATGPVGKTFVGALKVAADVAGVAADVLDSIPGPIRDIALQAGLAAAALPKLTGVVTTTTSSVRGQISALSLLRREIVATATGVPDLTNAVARVEGPSRAVAVQWGAMTPQATALRNGMLDLQKQAGSTASATNLARAAAAKLGPAASQAAGIGGLLLLTQGAQETNGALSTLETTLGGAATGFAVAGPWGLAIGGAAGLIGSLALNYEDAEGAARDAYRAIQDQTSIESARASIDSLKTSLNQVTGAYTGATRAAVLKRLEDSDLVGVAAKYGISQRTLVSAALGQKGALDSLRPVMGDYAARIAEVNAEIAEQTKLTEDRNNSAQVTKAQERIGELEQEKLALQNSSTELSRLTGELRTAGKETRENAVATADYTGKLKGLPKGEIRQKIKAEGIEASVGAVARLARQYKLVDKKQIRALIKVAGQGEAFTSVKKVQQAMEGLKGVRADTSGFSRGVATGVSKSIRVAERGSGDVKTGLEQGVKKAKPDLSPFMRTLKQTVNQAINEGKRGNEVGSALKTGVIGGFAGTQAQLVSQAVAAVRAAIQAAKKEGRINSPSKETEYLGRMLGLGLAVGMEKTKGQTTASAAQLTAGILSALSDQTPVQANLATIGDYVSGQFDSLLETTTAGIERRYDRAQKVLDRRYKRTQARLKKNLDGKAEARALRNAENAYDRSSQKIEKGRRKDTQVANAASAKAQQQALAATAAQRQALAENVQRQKDITAEYETQSQALEGLIDQSQQYAAGIRDGVVASGSLSTLAQNGATSLVKLLKGRTKALADARAFNTQMAQLTAAGLNQTDLKDLVDLAASQGAGAASKIATALLQGGPDAVYQLNTLNADLQTAGQQLGNATASTLYDAGITAKQGLLAGLTSDAQAAIAQAEELGRQIAAGLAAGLASAANLPAKEGKKNADKVIKGSKNRFGIASPSRVFRSIGRDVNRGLALGLGDTYVTTRAAGNLATAVTDSFGTPALDAYLASRAPAASAPAVMTDPALLGRDAPLIGQVIQQPGESAGVFAERLAFLINTRG